MSDRSGLGARPFPPCSLSTDNPLQIGAIAGPPAALAAAGEIGERLAASRPRPASGSCREAVLNSPAHGHDRLSGLAAAILGATGAVVFGGAGAIFVTMIWAWYFPELRRAKSFEPAALKREVST